MRDKGVWMPDGVGAYFGRLARGWNEILEWRPVRRVLPSRCVRILGQGGRSTLVRMPGFEVVDRAAASGSAHPAIEVPEDSCLERRLALPHASDQDLRAAVQLEVEAVSPFPADEVVFGWRRIRDDDGEGAMIAMTSAALVQNCLAELGAFVGNAEPEVWAWTSAGYVALNGYGERKRHEAQRSAMNRSLLASVAAAMATAALAAMPVIEKRGQAIEAQHQLEALTREAAPVLAARDHLAHAQSLLDEIRPRAERKPDLPVVLDQFSHVLPDGAWLDLFEYSAGTLRVGGRADDAAGLLQALQRHGLFANVHAPSPIVREPQTGKERFLIEMELSK